MLQGAFFAGQRKMNSATATRSAAVEKAMPISLAVVAQDIDAWLMLRAAANEFTDSLLLGMGVRRLRQAPHCCG